MRRSFLTFVLLGIVASSVLSEIPSAAGQKPADAARRRGNRPSAKSGEVITRPDRGERWTDQIQLGKDAPEFTLPLLPKEQPEAKNSAADSKKKAADKTTDQTVSLRDLYTERPVVLIFGSITCPPFRGQLESVDAVYDDFKDRAEFLFVYIREAHPDSVLSVSNADGREGLLKFPQPTDDNTRRSNAVSCQRTMQLRMPVAVDKIDNPVGKAYAGWPNRMVIVGTDGKVIFASDPSPRGTDAARLRAWLKENLAP